MKKETKAVKANKGGGDRVGRAGCTVRLTEGAGAVLDAYWKRTGVTKTRVVSDLVMGLGARLDGDGDENKGGMK